MPALLQSERPPSPAPAQDGAVYQATIKADAATGGRIARALDGAEEPAALAVGYFDLGDGRFEVSAQYAGAPSRDALTNLIEAAARGEACGPLSIDAVADEDWVTLSQEKRAPVRAGRFLIHGSHDRGAVPPGRHVIEIDASSAFGTAHHASTRGCLLALDALIKRRRPDLVLDLGTGTGVLAIAAARALDRPVVATDNDPLAVAIAAENARKAGVGQQVYTVVAEGFGHPALRRLKPDLILANILARPLSDLAPAMARALRPGGTAILSGLTDTQAKAIEARYRAHRFTAEKRIILDGWTTLVVKRRSARVLCD
jgi:ribosomal protein L11 methyltransferase